MAYLSIAAGLFCVLVILRNNSVLSNPPDWPYMAVPAGVFGGVALLWMADLLETQQAILKALTEKPQPLSPAARPDPS